MIEPVLVLLLVGAAVAGFTQGLSGFAFSMVALSVWAWVIGPQLSAPLAVFGALIGQLVALPFVRSGFSLRLLAPFVVGGLIGVPFGTIVLRGLDPAVFRLALGMFLVLYVPLALTTLSRFVLTGRRPLGDGLVGWAGGVLGGISGIAGPVPALWASMRGWSKDEQRGVVQVFNLTMHVATLTAYGFAGVYTPAVWSAMLPVAPVVAVTALLGVLLFKRLDVATFRRIVLTLLFASGVTLVVGSVPALLGA